MGIIISIILYILAGQKDQRLQLQERLGPPIIIQGFNIQSCQGNAHTEEIIRNVSCSECLQIPTAPNETTIYKSVCTPRGKPSIEEAKVFLCEDFNNCGTKKISNIFETITFGQDGTNTANDKLINGLFSLGIAILAGVIIAFLTGTIGTGILLTGLIIGSLLLSGSTMLDQQSASITGNQRININSLSQTCYAQMKPKYDINIEEGIKNLQSACAEQVCSTLGSNSRDVCKLQVRSNILGRIATDITQPSQGE